MTQEAKIPTNTGMQTVPEIMNSLYYSSYAANRDYGMSHSDLMKIGIGNERFKKVYEGQKYPCPIIVEEGVIWEEGNG